MATKHEAMALLDDFEVSKDAKRVQLYVRELGGSDFISFDLFRLRSWKARLKPCGMTEQKVVAFVTGCIPESTPAPSQTAKPCSP